jgi:hypothetical protein
MDGDKFEIIMKNTKINSVAYDEEHDLCVISSNDNRVTSFS